MTTQQFDDIIKGKLISYEAPFDGHAQSWIRLAGELDAAQGTSQNPFGQYLIGGIAATVALVTLFTTLPDRSAKSHHTPAHHDVAASKHGEHPAAEFAPQEIHLIELGTAEKTVGHTMPAKTQNAATSKTEVKASETASAAHAVAQKQTPNQEQKIAAIAHADFTAKGIQCAGKSIRFAAQLNQHATVTWMFDGTFMKDGLSTDHSFETAGEHEARMTATFDDGSHITLKRTVTIFEQPSAAFDFAMTENTRCFLSEATFKAMPTGNHYKWMLNGDSIGKGSTLNTRLKNGLYTVGLVAVSEAGCATTNTYPVRVETANQLIAPKAFSDNADGLNDAWEISGLDMAASFELVITRVQGNTVAFRSTSQTSWDGSINGTAERPAKGEHFTWVLTATDECGNRTQEGGVLLYLR